MKDPNKIDAQVFHTGHPSPANLINRLQFMGYTVLGHDPYNGAETGVWFLSTDEQRMQLRLLLKEEFSLL